METVFDTISEFIQREFSVIGRGVFASIDFHFLSRSLGFIFLIYFVCVGSNFDTRAYL